MLRQSRTRLAFHVLENGSEGLRKSWNYPAPVKYNFVKWFFLSPKHFETGSYKPYAFSMKAQS